MKYTASVILGACLALSAQAQSNIVITSFSSNGELTWESDLTNATFMVEWAPTLTPDPAWRGDWLGLQHIYRPLSGTNTAAVPMFYRVVASTNPVLRHISVEDYSRLEVGRTWTYVLDGSSTQGTFSVVGVTERQGNQVYECEWRVEGEWIETDFFDTDMSHSLLHRGGKDAESFPDENFEVPGITFFARSFYTGRAYPYVSVEREDFSDVYIRTNTYDFVTATVPAGTFSNCLHTHTVDWNVGHDADQHERWWAPGVGLVKFVGDGIELTLQSVTD